MPKRGWIVVRGLVYHMLKRGAASEPERLVERVRPLTDTPDGADAMIKSTPDHYSAPTPLPPRVHDAGPPGEFDLCPAKIGHAGDCGSQILDGRFHSSDCGVETADEGRCIGSAARGCPAPGGDMGNPGWAEPRPGASDGHAQAERIR